ncbi:hypothetical protein T02_1798 [Trichinella nativa]|uniref:Uncharacterized protein n=2 Tax=Trichinella TaxID=6333 RepID=A0A0V1LVE6_9BILA|nr:hypothetical protein T05_7219 [Trichinella murrelli]KRZ63478.1 hypothetical protein T02_1798 [Trichinella nativa]
MQVQTVRLTIPARRHGSVRPLEETQRVIGYILTVCVCCLKWQEAFPLPNGGEHSRQQPKAILCFTGCSNF